MTIKRIFLLLLCAVYLSAAYLVSPVITQNFPPMRVREIDGTPTVNGVREIRVTNGKLTNLGSGIISLDLGSSAGTITTAGLTPNFLPMALTSTTLGDSLITQSANVVTVGNISTGGFQVDVDNRKLFAYGDNIVDGVAIFATNELKGEAQLAGARGGTGVANSGKTITLGGNLITSGAFATTLTVTNTTGVTLPTTGTLATLAGSEELTNKTLNASVGKGTWTASGTWTLPAHTLGGTVSGGANQLNNVQIGASSPLAGSFTTLVGTTLNGNTFTTGTYTLTGTAAKTLSFTNTLTLSGTDGSTLNIGAGGTLGSNAFTSTAYAASGANSDITSLSGVTGITGGASNMTITSGTGNSRTMILRTTTSGGTATTFLTGNADQSTTFAGQVLATAGATATPGLSFSAAPTVGFREAAAGVIFTTSSADIWYSSASVISMRNNGSFAFSSTTDPTATADTALERNAAGILAVTNGSGSANLRDLKLRALTMGAAGLLSISSGTNQRAGNLTLVGGTSTVSNTTVTANSIVILTRKTSGGTIGTAITYTLSAGTSFTVNSDNILDTSTFSYMIIEVP